MAVFSNSDFVFLEININGQVFPQTLISNVKEVITPEFEDPYWEITYVDVTDVENTTKVIFATGNVYVIVKQREDTIKIVKRENKEPIAISKKREDNKSPDS